MQAIHISSYNNIIMAHNLQHTKYNNKNIMHIYDSNWIYHSIIV